MKKQTISAQMSSPKYNALTYYLEKQNKTLEGELREHLDEMYKEQVPKDVQEYIASQNPEEDEAPEQKTGKPSKRQSMKQKQDAGEQSNASSGPVLSM